MQLKYLTLFALASVATPACVDSEAPWFVETLIASNTTDPVGDYTITTVVTDNVDVAWVRLHYQRGLQLGQSDVELEQSDTQNVWLGKIPGVSQTTRVFYFLEAADDNGNIARDPALEPDLYSFWVNIAPTPPHFLDAGVVDSQSYDSANEDATVDPDATASDTANTDAGATDVETSDANLLDTGADAADAATLDSRGEDS